MKFKRPIAAIAVIGLLIPGIALAQVTPTDPAQDPYALTPEKLKLFQGYESNNTLNSLFNGDGMKDNGLFTPTVRQLGGASPDLTAPVRDNEEEVQQGPTFLVIRSEYTPSGDLTKDSIINLKVTLHNIGENTAKDIVFSACVQDNYIILLDDPAPEPPFTNNPEESISDGTEDEPQPDTDTEPTPFPTINDPTVNNCYMRLEWDALEGGDPITLEPDQEATFTWSFQPQKDDVVIRWRFVAEFGAGQSMLRQWIPVKNPNPTGGVAPGANPGNGIPVSCTTSGGSQSIPFPDGDSMEQIISAMESRWGFTFEDGSYSWRNTRYKPVVEIWWDTLSAVECTPFLTDVNSKNGGGLPIYAQDIGVYWGNYGLTYPGALSINVENQLSGVNNGIPEKVSQNIIHELGHAYNNDRGSNPAYWVDHNQIYNSSGPISGYGASSITENFADVVGYYVARCSGESFGSAGPNPYASGHTEFYNLAKEIFGGVEFGPPAPSTVTC